MKSRDSDNFGGNVYGEVESIVQSREDKGRELILHIGLITMEIPLKLFLDMEPSPSANVVSAWAIDSPSKPLLLNPEKRHIQLAQNKQQSIIFLHEVHCTEAAIDTWRSE